MPLRRPFSPTLMDTHKFKSNSINETEFSNGEGGGGGVFSGRGVGIYVFITRSRLQRLTRQELRIEMRCVQCDYQREKASWRQCGVKRKKKKKVEMDLFFTSHHLAFDLSVIERQIVEQGSDDTHSYSPDNCPTALCI